MGAASALRRWLGNTLGQGRHPFAVIARPASASPAGGSAARHEREQRELIERAFDDANHDSRETHGDAS